MKDADIKLPFGLNEYNILVHITDVERGKKCLCFCPSCKVPLIAAKGDKIQHHFKHEIDNECEHGLESAIHLAAKKIIIERKQIALPGYDISATATDSRGIEYTQPSSVVEEGRIISFDSVQEEKELHEMKADILATASSKNLIIEIFYRHKVTDQKLEKIKTADISAIEINLSDLKADDVKNWEAFWSSINDPKRIKWLHNAKAQGSIHRSLKNQLAEKIQVQEKKYQQEELRKQLKQKKEKEQLAQAINNLKFLRSERNITRLNQNAKVHPAWKYCCRYLPFSWGELPSFLNVDVPNGDWIFGCDRRVWQAVFYSSFILRDGTEGKSFSVKGASDWLNDKARCTVHPSVKVIGVYGMRYFNLIPADLAIKIPSPLETLRAYFNYLCQLNILEFSGENRRHFGNYWFRIVRKIPDAA